MLSRRHIRVKVMQALYIYFNDRQNVSIGQLTRQMDSSISRLYELYLYLLLFLEEMGQYMIHYDEEVKSRYIQNPQELKTSLKLYQNPILQKLMNSEKFHKTAEKYKVVWQGEDTEVLRRIFLDLKNQDVYREYIQLSDTNPVLHQEIILFILKHYTSHLSILQQHMEDQYSNWMDDKKIALQMATKTVQNLAGPTVEGEDFLLPISPNPEEIYEYAENLLKLTIDNNQKLEEILAPKISKWEPHQIAMIDNIILKMAVTEFMYFPSIPSKVTINEYIELAKNYSTPQSKKFINGVLDAIQKDFIKDGIIPKV